MSESKSASQAGSGGLPEARLHTLASHLIGASTAATSETDTRAAPKQLKSDARITLRRLEEGDFSKGFPAILSQLTDLGSVDEAAFKRQFARISSSPEVYHCFVGEDVAAGRIACAATLIIEDKFIHGCGRVGHVEDVVVDKNYRGLNLGAV